MKTTYARAQYSTPSGRELIRTHMLGDRTDADSIAAAAAYLSRTLRVGTIRQCKQLVLAAIAE